MTLPRYVRLRSLLPLLAGKRFFARRRTPDQMTGPGDRGLMLFQRLEEAGLDPGYIHATQPGLFQDLAQTCCGCGYKGRCSHDLATSEFNERVVAYCPNTERIDELIVKKFRDIR